MYVVGGMVGGTYVAVKVRLGLIIINIYNLVTAVPQPTAEMEFSKKKC